MQLPPVDNHPSSLSSVTLSAAYEIPSVSGHSTQRLNSELDSFYSDIASIEFNQEADVVDMPVNGLNGASSSLANGSPAAVAPAIAPSHPPAHASVDVMSSSSSTNNNNKGTVVVEKASKGKRKKVKTSLSDIKDMSHLISKWQKAQQDL